MKSHASRYRALRLRRRFEHSYQPPIDCAHRWGPTQVQQMSAGLLRLESCQFCGLVIGSLV
jgi:hypothetical protein